MAKYKVAIATTDQKNVDQHFGKCDRFTIAEVDDTNGSYRIVEERATFALCGAGDTDENMDAAVNTLSDCAFVIVERIGRWPYATLYARGIESVEFSGSIEDAIERLLKRKD
jgi:predicted Fe-Mo cluster-binding NifX family protein